MTESIDRAPKPTLEQLVAWVVSSGRIGDTKNNFLQVQFPLSSKEYWSLMEGRRVATYEEYISEKYKDPPELANAVIAATDQDFIRSFNELAHKTNELIGKGVSSEEQAAEVARTLNDATTLVDEYCSRLP